MKKNDDRRFNDHILSLKLRENQKPMWSVAPFALQDAIMSKGRGNKAAAIKETRFYESNETQGDFGSMCLMRFD